MVSFVQSPAGARWLRRLVILAVLMGLVAMHHLADTSGYHHDGMHALPCPATPDDCPEIPHGVPGQVCQAPAPGQTGLMPLARTAHQVSHPPVCNGDPTRSAPVTTAPEAGPGTGYGRPALTELARFRI